MPFETPFAEAVFTFEDLQAVPHEHPAPGLPLADPTTIIRTDQSWAVQVSWRNTGLATGMIDGQWHLHVFAESLGPGAEVMLTDLPEDHIFDLEPGPAPSYNRHFHVNAGALPVGPAGVTLYKLVTSLTYIDAAGNRGPMAAYVEGPIIQVYDPN
jgi:hypothetical protein